MTEDDLRAAVRWAGFDSLDKVHAVVLETNGSFSVVRAGEGGSGSSLVDVNGPQAVREPAER